MSMLAATGAWWSGRDRRERRMLAVMLALLAAFAWWYGLMWPLRALHVDARARHDDAALSLQAAEALAAASRARGAALPVPAHGDVLVRRLLDHGQAAGVVVSRHRTDAGGSVVLTLDRVPAPRLFAWLDGIEREFGVVPASMQVTRGDAGGVRAELAFDGGRR
jgi:general secretion pathway protein M